MDVPGETPPGYDNREHVVFIGGFSHSPNVDAVIYFVKQILPLVIERLPDVGFSGRRLEHAGKKFASFPARTYMFWATFGMSNRSSIEQGSQLRHSGSERGSRERSTRAWRTEFRPW